MAVTQVKFDIQDSLGRMRRQQDQYPSKNFILVSHASLMAASFRHLLPPLPLIKLPPPLSKSLPSSSMADTPPLAEVEIRSEGHERGGLSTPQILALLTLLPTGGTLLLLAGLIFAVTMVGLAVAIPLTVIFSPVLVPAVIGVVLAVSGFVTSETLVVTGVSALSCAWESVQRVWRPPPPEPPLKDMVDSL